MLINKNVIIWGETHLAISCMEYLLNNAWNIHAVVTRDSNVINWCKEKHIQFLSIKQAFTLPKHCYLFSIINPYIISSELLIHLEPICAINYHDSLLPKYAGVNSTTWAILANEAFHGISWHEITTGIDEGDIYYQTKMSIDEIETAFSLNLKCTEAALASFRELITDIEQNKLTTIRQDLSQKTYFGRDQIPYNYAILNPNSNLAYVNRLFNSLNFGSGYSNQVATVKIKLDEKYYILERQLPPNITQQADLTNYILKNIYGKNEESFNFDFTQIEACTLSNKDVSNLKKLKQQEFTIYNNLEHTLSTLERQSGLLLSSTPKARQDLEINVHIPTETLCAFLSIILNNLNVDNTFIKIYHAHLGFTHQSVLENITEQISILTINSENLDLSYDTLSEKIVNEVNHNRFYTIKDFSYRYNINLCSEFAITDNYQGIIDEHAIVFAINHDKVTVNFYETDTDFIKMLIKTIDVLFTEHHAARYSNIQIKNIQLLSKEDYQKIVYDWNKTEKEYPENKTTHQLFEEQVARTPDNIAVVYENIKLTYKELNERSNKIANYLRETYQIIGDDLIALCLDRSEHMLIAILAVLKSGAAYVPIDPTYPDERIKYILEDTKAKTILINENYQDKLNNVVANNICVIDNAEFQSKIKRYSSANLISNITSTNSAYVIYTSGTTGKPKGIVIEHKSVVNLVLSMSTQYNINSTERILLFANYVFDASVEQIFLAITNGCLLLIPNKDNIKDSNKLISLITENQITHFHSTPRYLATLDILKFSHLKRLISGGDYLSYMLYDRLIKSGNLIINEYGPTEATITSLVSTNALGIGKPISNVQAYIFNNNLNILPIGAVGELYLGGVGIARGYLNQPLLTKNSFIDNPFQTINEKRQNKNERLYKTGDLVRYLPDGNLEYIGRNDFQVKINGFRIELGEIENAFNSYPGIKQAVAIAYQNADSNKYLVAYYVADYELQENEIFTHLEKNLPSYMIPNVIVPLKTMPLTHNGKLDKNALPNPAFMANDTYVAPIDFAELKACIFYEEVLNLPDNSVGVNHDFFKLGGNSILAINLLYKLQQEFKIDLNDIFILRTPARIAKLASFTKNSLYHRLKLMKTIYDRLDSYTITPEMEEKQSAYLKQVDQVNFSNKLKNIKVVLLTGSTGHLGCHILYQLLFETKYKIYLLIRAASNKDAYSRINNKFQFYFDQNLDNYRDRIIPLAADIEKADLGLNNDQYKALSNRVDSIIHSAALVKHYGDYTTFYNANVQATINLLELTMLTHLKDFHYISTLSVVKTGYIPNVHYHLFTEEDDGLELKNNNIYVRTKHEGELAVISYREFGLNSNIYRVGNLAMNAKTYKSQENIEENAFFTKVKTIIDVGMIPNEISQVEISPVDSTALAVARLFAQVELSNQTYHVANSHLCDLSQLFTQHKNIKIKNVEFEEFIEALLIRLNNKINQQQVESFMLHQGWLEDVNLQDLIQIAVLQDKTDMVLSKLNFSWSNITSRMISDVITKSFSRDKKMQKKEPIFEYLEQIAELIPAPTYWLDLSSRFVGLNTLSFKASGAAKREDVVGKSPYELYKNENIADELQKDYNRIIQTGIGSQTEDMVVDVVTGKLKYFSATRAPLRNKRGEIVGIIGTGVEITAEKEKLENKVKLSELENKAKMTELENEALQAAAKEQEKFKKAIEQMMHDITSPITSINTIISKLGHNVAETDRVTLRHAAERIEGISQKLLNQYDKNNTTDAPENLLVSIALLQILNEKREEHLDSGIYFETDIDDDARFCFIKHNSGMFKRMISNMINNAVDALQNVQKSKITITLTVSPKSAIITVEDNGPGMPQHIQDKFNQGIAVTEGKEDGHGIGLTQVFDAINFGSGKCEIYASKNGTQICIYFPKVAVPEWIATEVKLTRDDTVIILDDDESIHGAWDNKFESILANIPTLQIQHFTHGKDVIQHINNLTAEQKENTYLLTDYELLDQDMNGLDVVEQTKMKRATLVTSYATQSKIQDRVSSLGIRMLPKELVSNVQINVDKKLVKGSKIVDMVWVEDQKYLVNSLIEKYYSHLKIDVYYDPISFMEDVIQYPLDTRIILDTYYNADDIDETPYMQTGYDLAKELHALGFTKLIIFTGEDPKGRAPEYLQVMRKKEASDTESLDKI